MPITSLSRLMRPPVLVLSPVFTSSSDQPSIGQASALTLRVVLDVAAGIVDPQIARREGGEVRRVAADVVALVAERDGEVLEPVSGRSAA